MLHKKRVLVPIVGQGSVMALVRSGLLENMKDFCEPVIAILWKQEDLIEELYHKGFETHLIPAIELSGEYVSVRQDINYWFQHFILKSPSTKINSKYSKHFVTFKKRIKKSVTNSLSYSKFLFDPSLIGKLKLREKQLLFKETAFIDYAGWIEGLNVEAIFTVTPFLMQVEIIGRVLKLQQKKIIAGIHSFDNITKRPWAAIHFDHYSVWNRYNKEELQRIFPSLEGKNIFINGAPQFDFHFNKNLLLEKEEWKKLLGIETDAKIILYAGGWHGATPNEGQYLRDIAEAVRANKFSAKPVILLRCHPLDNPDRWKKLAEHYPEIFFDVVKQGDIKYDHANVTETDIKRFCSTLYYTDVHISLGSTMVVDGCAFGKPQIAPYYDNIKAEKYLRKLYHQEHYLPILRSGALQLAYSKEQLIRLIDGALEQPEKFNGNCKKCLDDVITYTDGRTAQRITDNLRELLAS